MFAIHCNKSLVNFTGSNVFRLQKPNHTSHLSQWDFISVHSLSQHITLTMWNSSLHQVTIYTPNVRSGTMKQMCRLYAQTFFTFRTALVYIPLQVWWDAHRFFIYSVLHYTCSACFRCYLYPSSGAQTMEYSRRAVPAATCSNGLSNFQHSVTITHTYGCTPQFVLLMMGANSTWNTYSKYSIIKNI
jgi:hypothetical protein